jgi:S-adenosylmethionine:tRNA-ribosyltransferase-isomerase (queuine synthetase)
MAKLTDEQRRALQLLARSPNGCTEALMLAYHFTTKMLDELAADGLLTIDIHHHVVDGRQKTVERMQITPAGRREIAE